MTTLTKGLLVGGGLFIAFEAFRYFAVKEMTMSIESISASQDKLVTNLLLNVRVVNPTQWTNTLDSLQGNITVNGNLIGAALVQGPWEVPAQTRDSAGNLINGVIDIPVKVALLDLVLGATIVKIFTGQVAQANISFEGKVRANGIPIPIPIHITYAVI